MTRLIEIDFFRGIALLSMIYFHVIFDLHTFFQVPVSYEQGINPYIGRLSGCLFIFISGVSCHFEKKPFKKAFLLLCLGVFLTLVTWGRIKFGILHFLGISTLIGYAIRGLPAFVLFILAPAILALDPLVKSIHPSHDYLCFLGIKSSQFYSMDYYALVPWLGFFIYGLWFGKVFYLKNKMLFPHMKTSLISTLGQKTLVIYLLHQPVLLSLFFLVRFLFQTI